MAAQGVSTFQVSVHCSLQPQAKTLKILHPPPPNKSQFKKFKNAPSKLNKP